MMYEIGNTTTAAESCRPVLPTCQNLGEKRFAVIRQTQKATAKTIKVTDSPCCPWEFVFVVMFSCFYSGSKHTCSGHFPLLGREGTKKVQLYNWGQSPIVLFCIFAACTGQ